MMTMRLKVRAPHISVYAQSVGTLILCIGWPCGTDPFRDPLLDHCIGLVALPTAHHRTCCCERIGDAVSNRTSTLVTRSRLLHAVVGPKHRNRQSQMISSSQRLSVPPVLQWSDNRCALASSMPVGSSRHRRDMMCVSFDPLGRLDTAVRELLPPQMPPCVHTAHTFAKMPRSRSSTIASTLSGRGTTLCTVSFPTSTCRKRSPSTIASCSRWSPLGQLTIVL